MYFIIKCNCNTGAREVVAQSEDAAEAFSLANTFDVKYKVGAGDDEEGEPYVCVGIEDESGVDKWQECARIACPPIGMFN